MARRTVPGAVCPARSAPHGSRRRLPGPKRPARFPPPSLLLARGESALRRRGPTYKDGPDSLSAFFPQADLDPTVATTLAPCRSHRPADRKSTRLNSSHVAISYAVFCLKKKKKLTPKKKIKPTWGNKR